MSKDNPKTNKKKDIINTEKIRKEILSQLTSPIVSALNDQGITPSYLAKKLKKELEAKQSKVFIHKGEIIYSDPMDLFEIQQRARIDAHKLLDHYPAEKYEVDGITYQVIDYSKIDIDT